MKSLLATFAGLLFAASLVAQGNAEEGIPVTDPLVIQKCGSCHTRDAQGSMQRISFLRNSPEGWQEIMKAAIVLNGAMLTAPEARAVLKYLSTNHGLSPEEAKPVMYWPERRVRDETTMGSEEQVGTELGVNQGGTNAGSTGYPHVGVSIRNTCTRCHGLARTLSSRRSFSEWKALADKHLSKYGMKDVAKESDSAAIAYLAKAAGLRTPEWTAWNNTKRAGSPAGRWLVTAKLPGQGSFYGEMDVERGNAAGEFNTRVRLRSALNGTMVTRTGFGLVYDGYAWRGRSKGENQGTDPDSPTSDAREVMLFSPDQAKAEGRWFWGQYQEFGFDVKLQRATPDLILMGMEGGALRNGSRANRIRIFGENLPNKILPADLKLGPGITVRSIVMQTATELVAEVDVRADAHPGNRTLLLGKTELRNAAAVYDRIDYIKVIPESSLASYGEVSRPRGYQQFEAIGYQRGEDGRRHTEDDLEVGPVDVTWSLKVFYATDDSPPDHVGVVNANGLFIPNAKSPNNNFDTWVTATAKTEKDARGKAMVGKASLVVAVPYYTFKGRRYIRELERWIDDGPAQ